MSAPIAPAHHVEARLQELQAAALAAGSATDDADYAQSAVEALGRLVGSERCSLMVLRDRHLYMAGSVGLSGEFGAAVDGLEIGPHAGTCGSAAFRKQAVISPDLDEDPKWEQFRDLARLGGVRSCWSVPLALQDGTVLGTFATYRDEPSTPDQGTVEVAQAHASLVALGLERIHRDARVAEGYGAVVVALSSALDVRDEYTGSHSTETAALVLEAGRRLGIEGDELRGLEQAALLHDIGKLGIPTEILHAPRALTESERVVMEQHPVIGERILGGIPFLEDVAKAVRHEHERWDGGGYPDGIAGERIPLASRLVFVCDAWHAMTSDRPYRKALDPAVAREELRVNAGTQFDPRAVEVVLDLVSTRPPMPAAEPDDGAEEGAREELLQGLAESIGAEDLLVFRLVAPGHFSHMGGVGRGEGWAGNVELQAGDERHFSAAVRRGEVVCLDFVDRGRVAGPYYASTAAIAPIGEDTVVIFGSSTASLREACTRELGELAQQAADAVHGVSPAKRLADELEVLEAVRAVTAVEGITLEETLSRMAEVTARSLSCEFGAVVARDLTGEIRIGLCERGWTPPPGNGLAALLAPLTVGRNDLPLLAQDAGSHPAVPAELADAGVTSLHAFSAGHGLEAAMLMVHADTTPRGFTVLCRRLARSVGEAAEPVIGRALAAERVAESHPN